MDCKRTWRPLRLKLTNWLVPCLWAATTASASAQEFRIESVGGRYGFSTNNRTETFHQAEAFANWNLPWHWLMGSHWQMKTRLDVSAGWLGDENADGFVGTAGPTVILRRERVPISVELGCSPTILSRDSYGDKDFGIPFQFTSHFGLNWEIGSHFSVNYRCEHMSNAHIADPNPGLNMQMFGLSYRF